VFGNHPGGFQGRRVDVHHREFLVHLRCQHNDLRARYMVRASGTLAPTGVEGRLRYRDRAMGRCLMLAATEWRMDTN
jgi:hypothetical protein